MNYEVKRNGNYIMFSKEQEEEIINMYTQKRLSTVEIGNIFYLDYRTICKFLEKK